METTKEIQVSLGERSYEIVIKAGVLQELQEVICDFCGDRSTLIVTDTNIEPLYIENLEDCNSSIYVFPAGEKSKNIDTISDICRQAVAAGLDRKSIIVAFGGGVCGDMAGFAAAIYMRGIDFIQIPTSLLAMVDSSVGGKTGVDLPEGKNLIGAFWQPKLVVIDPETLKTLPVEEIRNGLAEVVKYGMIQDWKFFELLERNVDALKNLRMELYTELIRRCCEIKAEVVEKDEREGGLRAILNYGHTFGHAIELLSEFKIAHGAAISIGMAVAAKLGVMTEKIDEAYAERQNSLLKNLGLPVQIPSTFDPEEIYDAMLNDKKTLGSKIKLVLPVGNGAVSLFDDIDSDLIIQAIKDCCE